MRTPEEFTSHQLATFFADVAAYKAEHPEQRYGQVVFNVFTQHFPREARLIAGTSTDPFHNEDNLKRFSAYLAQLWSLS